METLQERFHDPSSEWAKYHKEFQPVCHAALTAVARHSGHLPNNLCRLAARQVCVRHGLGRADVPVTAALMAAISEDALCGLMLTGSINFSLPLERFLTGARRYLLGRRKEREFLSRVRPLLIALAHQGFNNEFVWAVTDEEGQVVSVLGEELGTILRTGGVMTAELPLLLYSLYRPLAAHPEADMLAAAPLSHFAADLHTLIVRALLEPRREAELREAVPALEEVQDRVSRSVRAQYEESPYPRWLKFTREPQSIESRLRRVRPGFAPPTKPGGEPRHILVAGCGTGRHSLSVALGNPDAKILAVDLSSASLAYAMRMTERYGVSNIQFLQGDLLALPRLGRKFHHIECGGVLHHIRDHAAAWAVLSGCLHPGGTMRIGVYSKAARLLVSHLRACIQQEGVGVAPAEVRRFRARLLTEPAWAKLVPLLEESNDFFSLSMTRDLLFHVQEYQYTVSEIENIVQGLGLELVGVHHPSGLRGRIKSKDAAASTGVRTFAQWRACEAAYVGSLEMFQFWLHKKEPASLGL